MSESAQHQKLVKTIIEYVETIVGKDKKCFITSDAADGMNISPLTAEGYRPDVFYQYDDVIPFLYSDKQIIYCTSILDG